MIHISVYDDKRLRADVDADDTQAYWHGSRLRNLPESKWHAQGFWTFPLTEPNVDALRQIPSDSIEYDESARTYLEYATLTVQLAKSREKRRWKYLFDDPSLHCAVQTVPGDGVCHTIVEDGGETRTYNVAKESFRHQAVGLDAIHGQEFFALYMEMGTGKTKVIIDEMALMAREKPVTVLVVCPKTILGTWERELVKWLPESIDVHTDRLRTGDDGMERLIRWVRTKAQLKVLFANYDRIVAMKDALIALKFNAIICDESSRLKNPAAKRTKAAIEIGPSADRRFILSGSPVVGSVLDFWGQFEFLSPGSLGYSTNHSFKNHYSNLNAVRAWEGEVKNGQFRGAVLQNIDELKRRVARHAFIVKKEQCLDLPDKLFQTITVPMGHQQREVYDQMVTLFMAELEMESGANGVVEARSTLAKLMRLAQITQGFIRNTGPDSDGAYMDIPDGDNKLKEILRFLKEDFDLTQKIIVWARFKRDIEHLSDAMQAAGITFMTLTGATPQCERDTLEHDFNEGPVTVLLAEPGTGGMGLTLIGNKEHPMRTMIYYSNDYSLEKRIQSEDRGHRIGQMHNLLIIDIACEGSIDEHITEKLQNKRDLSESLKDMSSIRELLMGNRSDLSMNGGEE